MADLRALDPGHEFTAGGRPSAATLRAMLRRLQRREQGGAAGLSDSTAVAGRREFQVRDEFVAIVTDEGPAGEADYADARYWVERAYVQAGAATDAVDPAAETDPVLGVTVTATNLAEEVAGTHSLAVGRPVRVFKVEDRSSPPRTRYYFDAGGAGGSAAELTYFEITGSTATGVVDALGNDVQWEYDLKPVERGAEVLAGTTGLAWTESTKALSKAGAFSAYTFKSGDVVVIAATTGVTAGEYVIQSRTDDDELILRESITGGSDATGVELTRIKRYSGYGAWADAAGTTIKGYNHFERENDGSGRQMNGIDHDGAAYPAGFQMRPIQTGVIVRAEVYEVALANGSTQEEAWFAHPNAEDGTCT